MKIDKTKMKDSMGKFITQSLFLEFNYSNFAMFTFDDDDKTYKGRVYPSLKKLYIAEEDPTEYRFANKYLLGWKHWTRLNDNAYLRPHFDEWRNELDLHLRAAGIRSIIDESGTSFRAAQWLADRGWDKNKVGRPTKDDPVTQKILEDSKDIIVRMENYKS